MQNADYKQFTVTGMLMTAHFTLQLHELYNYV